MTKGETVIVRQAIEDLMADEPQFTRAIGNLCKLVGWRYPASEVAGKPVSLQEIFERHQGG